MRFSRELLEVHILYFGTLISRHTVLARREIAPVGNLHDFLEIYIDTCPELPEPALVPYSANRVGWYIYLRLARALPPFGEQSIASKHA